MEDCDNNISIAESNEKLSLRKSRRGLPRYKKNPFLQKTSNNTKSGSRRITTGRDRLLVINEDTGEQLAGAGFFQWQEVDKTQFLKLYINGVKALTELTGAGTKVFEILYRTVQDFKDTDRVFLAYELIDQEIVKISESTYYRGMKELANKGFIAETTVQNSYFINPDYIFNGDRLSFVKSYILTESKSNVKKSQKHAVEELKQQA
ncbi:replication/maintenance protein RepL [Klebsiella aerogenes]